MFPSYFLLVYVLLSIDFSWAMMRRRTGGALQIGAPNQQEMEAVQAVNPQNNEAALVAVMGQDPCWTRPVNFEGVHAADTNCARAAAAFNSRDEALRHRCRFTVSPKCRLFGHHMFVMRCSVKKIRPKYQLFCIVLSMDHEIVEMVHCARPLYPNLPYVPPPEPAHHQQPWHV